MVSGLHHPLLGLFLNRPVHGPLGEPQMERSVRMFTVVSVRFAVLVVLAAFAAMAGSTASQVSGNTAPAGAGMISGGTTTVTDSTIIGNTATNSTGTAMGGGIRG